MTPPTTAEQSAALSALSGMELDPKVKRDVAYVQMISEALRRGITWRQIASAMGLPDGKAAKAAAKRLARNAERDLFRARSRAPEATE